MTLLSHFSAVSPWHAVYYIPSTFCFISSPIAQAQKCWFSSGPAQVRGTRSLFCALQPPVHAALFGVCWWGGSPISAEHCSLPAASLRVVLLLSQWGWVHIQLQGASSPRGLPGMAQCLHPTQPSRPGPGWAGGGELAGRSTGSQVVFRQNNSSWIVLQEEVLQQILGPRGSQQKPGHQTTLLNTASRSQIFNLHGYLHQCPATCAQEIKGSILPHCATLLPPALPCCSAFFCKAFL